MSQCFSDDIDKEMIIYLNKARLALDRDKPVNSDLELGTSYIDCCGYLRFTNCNTHYIIIKT